MDIVDDFEIMTFILLANTAACSSSLVIVEIYFLTWVRHFVFEVTIFESRMKRMSPSAFEYDSQINCLWTVNVEIEKQIHNTLVFAYLIKYQSNEDFLFCVSFQYDPEELIFCCV